MRDSGTPIVRDFAKALIRGRALIRMLCGKTIKETIVVDRLFNYLVFLVQWRAMCLRLPEVRMLEYLFDDFRLAYKYHSP